MDRKLACPSAIVIDMKKVAQNYSIKELQEFIWREVYQNDYSKVNEELLVSKLEDFHISSTASVEKSAEKEGEKRERKHLLGTLLIL